MIPPALLVGLVVLCCWVLYWTIDGVFYQYVYEGAPFSNYSWEPVRDFGDVWRSMTAHYMEVNGRFFCHIIVTLVCSFVPQWLFAIINGAVLVLMLWMLCRESGIKSTSIAGVWSVTFMSWLAFDNYADPPFYINYLWMGTLVTAWIIMFVRHPKIKDWRLLFIGLFSILAGQSHECFAIPVGFALVTYLIMNRGRVSAFDWVAGLCFCITGLTTILSPGILIRIESVRDTTGFLTLSRYDIFSNLFIPGILVWVMWRYRHRLRDFLSGKKNQNRFWLLVFIGNLLLALGTSSNYGTRAFTIGSVAAIVFSMRLTPGHRLNRFWMAVMIAMSAWVTWARLYHTFGLTAKYKFIENVYLTEHPDTVWVPDRLYVHESRIWDKIPEYIVRTQYKLSGATEDSVQPLFTVLPESLKDVPRNFEGNICRKLDRNVYLLVQSKKHPARFVSHKRLLPSLIKFEVLPQREFIFADNNEDFDLFIDSTATWRAAYYTNEYIPYMTFDVQMTEAQGE